MPLFTNLNTTPSEKGDMAAYECLASNCKMELHDITTVLHIVERQDEYVTGTISRCNMHVHQYLNEVGLPDGMTVYTWLLPLIRLT